MSSEWVEEAELSSEEIHISTPSITIQCQIYRTIVDVLYNATVGANLMPTSFTHIYLGAELLALRNKSLRDAP